MSSPMTTTPHRASALFLATATPPSLVRPRSAPLLRDHQQICSSLARPRRRDASLSSVLLRSQFALFLLQSSSSVAVGNKNSTKEIISNLKGNISTLQVQVAELEESRNNLLLENQQLRENVSGLHSTIQNLENSRPPSSSLDASAKNLASENEDLKSQIEAACTLVEKLVAENAELVEKVHKLCNNVDKELIIQRFQYEIA